MTNPAGRLYELLTAYRQTAHREKSILQTWAAVLNVEDDVAAAVELCTVAMLIPQLKTAIDRSGDEQQRMVFAHHVYAWASPIIFPEHHGRQSPSAGIDLVDPGALVVLGGVSSFLDATATEGHFPTDQQVSELRQQIAEAIVGVTDDSDLPVEIRKLLLDRLSDILWALDHLRIVGPEGVTAAAERLGGSVIVQTSDEVRRRGIVKKVLQAASAAWIVFKLGPTVQTSIEGWKEVLDALPPGS